MDKISFDTWFAHGLENVKSLEIEGDKKPSFVDLESPWILKFSLEIQENSSFEHLFYDNTYMSMVIGNVRGGLMFIQNIMFIALWKVPLTKNKQKGLFLQEIQLLGSTLVAWHQFFFNCWP